jgi:hypothetical protein
MERERYADSLEILFAASVLNDQPGISQGYIGMAGDSFRENLREAGIDEAALGSATASDLVLLAEEAHRPFSGRFQVLVMERLERGDADDECLAFWASFLDARAMGASGLRVQTLAHVIDACQRDEVVLAYVRKAFSTHAALERTAEGDAPPSPHVRFDIDLRQDSDELIRAIFARADDLGPQLLALCVSCLDRCDAIRTCYGLHRDDTVDEPASLDGLRVGAAEKLLVSVIRELNMRPAKTS